LRGADAGAAGAQRRGRQAAGPADQAARMDSSDMSHTKRTPIARQPSVQISARALQLFEQLQRAHRQRRAASCIIGDSPAGYCSAACAACRRWYDLQDALHTELGLKPWQWLCLLRNPYPPGSSKFLDWRPLPDGEDQALWERL